MRPRFRSESGPRSTREGRPLELVRVRGSQRNSGNDSRDLNARRRRRGGRRRSRGPQPPVPPAPPAKGFSLSRWLSSLFARPPAARPPAPSVSELEARVLREFSEHYGLTFKRPDLLKLALTHRSYLSLAGGPAHESNERLEFLGDSVLGLVTSEHLFRTHPTEHEGQLTKTKSLLVSKAILSRRALAMGLGRFVLMSHSEIESGGRQRLSILADAFESVIGAVYLDQGFEASRAFIDRWLLKGAKEIVADKRHVNYKSHLQEYVQSTFRTHPVYRIRSEMGPDHSKHFMVEVVVGRRQLGEGKGRNKKEAEQAAARDALDRVSESRSGEAQRREPGGREPQAREASRREPHEHEPRPGREPRERGSREEPVREGPPAAVHPPQIAEGVEPETETEESMHRRRRRGRRGGRGRRRPEREGAPESAGRPTGAPEQARGTQTEPSGGEATRDLPARPLAREVREPREAREPREVREPREPREPREVREPREMREPRGPREAREVHAPRPREIEPLPPAAAEDEVDEVGRPEGPLGEHMVDPFEAGFPEPPAAAASTPFERPPAVETREPAPPRGFESEIEDEADAGDESQAAGRAEEPPATGGRPGESAGAERDEAWRYGRRQGRGKRNPSRP
ncbi:MAG TPA: ribonuclease III [Candidatus Eisenbacteria bacterium]|jgi:ribonuclease-3